MFKPRHDELHSFLEWRRQTRFIRHYGGPIMALVLFATCLCFVWRVRPQSHSHPVETRQPHVAEPLLQASKSRRQAGGTSASPY